MKTALFVIGLCLAAAPALADPQPWRVGVSAHQEQRAQKLLDAGNGLFLERKYPEALEKYRAAAAVWDHPAIRFNMVRCLIQIDKLVEAGENLKLALKYGAAPFEDGLYSEALSYEKLLAKQIGDLDIECKQPEVAVTLDGQPLAACPMKVTRQVTPGRHQVVATKSGFVTKTIDLVVAGADRQTVDVSLVPAERTSRVVHRWPTWRPWVIFGGGLVLAGFGGLVQLQAIGNMDDYDRRIGDVCDAGCNLADIDDSKKRVAEVLNKVAIGFISVGAATAIAGGVMLYMNRGVTVYGEKPRVGVIPVEGGGAFTVSGRF